eukprot:12348002-Ditylum_brightwellii.AAC.1
MLKDTIFYLNINMVDKKADKGNTAFTDCDVKACYDRVIPEISALAQLQAGLPDNAAKFFLKVLKQMKYHMGKKLQTPLPTGH